MSIFALDIGGTAIKYGMVTQKGELLSFGEHPMPNGNGQDFLAAILDLCAKHRPFDAIGVSTTGLVNSKTGSLLYAEDRIIGWSNTPIGDILKREFSVPVAVENDVIAAAIGEGAFGGANVCDTFMCIAFGNSVGSALVINGEVYNGVHGGAGEIAHTTFISGGKDCECGRKGCFGKYTSATALVAAAREVNIGVTDGRKLFELIDNGDKALEQVVERWRNWVSEGIASSIHLLDPGTVVLGGGIMSREQNSQEIARRVLGMLMPGYEHTKIIGATLGNHAGTLGAAYLAMKAAEDEA